MEQPSSQQSTPPTTTLSLPILQHVQSSHLAHGLRQGNYTKYRQYCARRLRRLRIGLHCTHGRKYQKRPLEPKAVTDLRQLEIVLVQAERAWSYAMALKEDKTPRARFHVVRRLQKAVSYAHLLLKLCLKACDDQTKLEAKAYYTWMKANYCMEHKEWAAAKNKFIKARSMYDQLAVSVDQSKREPYDQRIEEIETTIKFCHYNLGARAEDLTLPPRTVVPQKEEPKEPAAAPEVKEKEPEPVEEPMKVELVSCKPILFDLALSLFEPPDLTEKKKAPRKGFFSWWG